MRPEGNKDPIPVILVTGFLGSGKTSLLRHLAQTFPDWRMIFLVNEFARISVDGETLAGVGKPTHSVVGGSLFCECKAGDFIRTLRETVLAHHTAEPLDAVVVETSGMADPQAIGRLLADHGLGGAFDLRRIVAVVSPRKLPRLLANLPVVESQLRVADMIVINKTDIATPEEINEAERSARSLNPAAEVLRAEFCRIDFSVPGKTLEGLQGPLSTSEANPFSTREILWPTGKDIKQARNWLECLPDTILRVKGRIITPGGAWQIERSPDGIDITALTDASSGVSGIVVLIAHDDHEEDLDRAVAKFPGLQSQ